MVCAYADFFVLECECEGMILRVRHNSFGIIVREDECMRRRVSERS